MLRNEIVPPGSYSIRSRGDGSLAAYLGTCVGVTLRDRKAGLGCLVHLLLARPQGEIEEGDELFYASSGLPAAIDAFLEAGADPARIEAVVAGGALIGPVTPVDLELDIGGSTAEVVARVLEESSVAVLDSQTGGTGGFRLTFDCRQLATTIEVSRGTRYIPTRSSLKLDEEMLAEAIDAVNPIPQSVLRIMRMMRSGNYDVRAVANDIRSDQVLAARVLRLINTAWFSPARRIDSIERAIILLGEANLLQFVLTASMHSLYNEAEKGYSLMKGGLYHHAVGCAVIAERIARLAGLDSGLAYTGGLLHDLGKVVLDQAAAAHNERLAELLLELEGGMLERERELIGVDHAEAGSRLASSWDLPASLVDVIAHHHDPARAEEAPLLVRTVYLADFIMSRFHTGLVIETLDSEYFEETLEMLRISPSQLRMLLEDIPWGNFGALTHSAAE